MENIIAFFWVIESTGIRQRVALFTFDHRHLSHVRATLHRASGRLLYSRRKTRTINPYHPSR
jgi:hypothetical protein